MGRSHQAGSSLSSSHEAHAGGAGLNGEVSRASWWDTTPPLRHDFGVRCHVHAGLQEGVERQRQLVSVRGTINALTCASTLPADCCRMARFTYSPIAADLRLYLG